MKQLLKAVKYTGLGIVSLFVLLVVVAVIHDSFFYHPLTDSSVEDLLGQEKTQLSLEESIDFIGIDIHGDIFDYYKYSLDAHTVKQFVQEDKFAQYPLFADSLYLSPRQEGQVVFCRWKQTPLVSLQDQEYTKIMEFGNLKQYGSSREFAQAEYLSKPGNYYAYFSAYPIGNYVYVLVPSENALYLIRKRG